MQPSIHVNFTPTVQYLLRIGDTALILSHRLSEWAGHGWAPRWASTTSR